MHEPDFWTSHAEAMEMSIEGQRLIALEFAELLRDLWRWSVSSLDTALRELGRRWHLPPI